MIAALKGTIFAITPPHIIVMVSGVGYSVLVTPRFFASLKTNQTITVYIYTHVREDALELYGFQTQEELQLFKQLTSISGIGPKGAIAIVDQGVAAIRQAVVEGDVSFFTRVPRLGKKNAQKIIIELRPKLQADDMSFLRKKDTTTHEVAAALQSLGYSPAEINQALPQIPLQLKTTSDRVKYVLKNFQKTAV